MAAAALTFIKDYEMYSIVPKDSIIYRGQTDAFDIKGSTAILARRVVTPERHTFFGLNFEHTANNYGITVGLKVINDIKVLNINNVKAYKWLRNEMERAGDKAALAALSESYPLIRGKVHRDSDKDNDFRVLNFICDHTEYEGYIQPEMPKTEGGFMHSEMAVCKQHGISKVLQPIGAEALPDPSGRSFIGIHDEDRLRKLGQASERLRAAGRRQPSSPSSPRSPRSPRITRSPKMLKFGSPVRSFSYDSPPPQGGRHAVRSQKTEQGDLLPRKLTFGL